MNHETRLRATYALAQYVRVAEVLGQDAANMGSEPLHIRELFIGAGGADVDVRWLRLRLWYAYVYVAIEGWQKLKLEDSLVDYCIDDLGPDGELDALRRLRNAVFHFQNEPATSKLSDVLVLGLGSGMFRRIVSLQDAFERYFRHWRSETDLAVADAWSIESIVDAT